MLDAAITPRITSPPQGSRPAYAQDRAPGGSRGDWACCYTHPQAERRALARLTEQGFDAYLPLITVLRRDRATPSIRHRVQVPAFPRYLFVCIRSALWTPIKYTRGIAAMLLKPDGYPQTVTAAAVSALRAACAIPAPDDYWAPGTPCSLAAGPMRGLPGIVLELHHDIARIGILFLGQLRQISLHVDCLKPRDE
jgi:hypothetical protein